jgi:hypothetical protein
MALHSFLMDVFVDSRPGVEPTVLASASKVVVQRRRIASFGRILYPFVSRPLDRLSVNIFAARLETSRRVCAFDLQNNLGLCL